MSYACYLDGVEMPTPQKLTVKIKNQNKTLILLNQGEINFLRAPGLTQLTVPFTFPMLSGGRPPDYYLDLLEGLKLRRKKARFILVRTDPAGGLLFDTNLRVSLEDYSVIEDAKEGLDLRVDVNLKQWRSYGVKRVTVEETPAAKTVTVEKQRDAGTAPAAKSHRVVYGDTLWGLAAKYYGSGAQYMKIFNANRGVMSDPNIIYVGWELVIP